MWYVSIQLTYHTTVDGRAVKMATASSRLGGALLGTLERDLP
jgi:hypothetical protein